MEYLRLCILGLVQGVTEFLPISSDGHLNVAGQLFGEIASAPRDEDLTSTVVLHLGTLGSILVVYWNRLWQTLLRDYRVLGLLVVASVPAAIVGYTAEKLFESALKDPVLTGCMLPLNGLLLLWIARRRRGDGEYHQLRHEQALVIGLLQALAILPGISRSGTTIAGGIGVGLKRAEAATFSFLMAVPVIGGAVLLKLVELASSDATTVDAGPLVVGVIVSFVSGVVALKTLLRFLERGGLTPLAWWCIGLGVAVLGWQFAGPR